MDQDNDYLKRALFAASDGVLGAALLIFIGMHAGSWLDNKLHSAPWISIILCLLGGGLGLARMVAKVLALEDKSQPPKNK